MLRTRPSILHYKWLKLQTHFIWLIFACINVRILFTMIRILCSWISSLLSNKLFLFVFVFMIQKHDLLSSLLSLFLQNVKFCFFQKKIKLLNEGFIPYIVPPQTYDVSLLFSVDPSCKLSLVYTQKNFPWTDNFSLSCKLSCKTNGFKTKEIFLSEENFPVCKRALKYSIHYNWNHNWDSRTSNSKQTSIDHFQI